MAAQDATEDEEAMEDTVVEDEDDEAEVEEDEPTELVHLQVFVSVSQAYVVHYYNFYSR